MVLVATLLTQLALAQTCNSAAKRDIDGMMAMMRTAFPEKPGATSLEQRKIRDEWRRNWIFTVHGGWSCKDVPTKMQCFLLKHRKEIPLKDWECTVLDVSALNRSQVGISCSACGAPSADYIVGYSLVNCAKAGKLQKGQKLKIKRINQGGWNDSQAIPAVSTSDGVGGIACNFEVVP